jgi:hypothetical protein
LEEEVFYGIFSYMLKEKIILDETLMTWKKYGGSQCKLVVIFKSNQDFK